MQIHSSVSVLVVCAILYAGQTDCARTVIKAPPEFAGPMLETISACIQETKNNPEEIMAAIKENKVFADEAFLTFIDCTFQKSGYGKPDGTVDVEKAIKIFPTNIDMKTVFENCNKDNCKKENCTRAETTLKFYKCYQKTSPVQLAL